jgi:hypothetical protein
MLRLASLIWCPSSDFVLHIDFVHWGCGCIFMCLRVLKVETDKIQTVSCDRPIYIYARHSQNGDDHFESKHKLIFQL